MDSAEKDFRETAEHQKWSRRDELVKYLSKWSTKQKEAYLRAWYNKDWDTTYAMTDKLVGVDFTKRWSAAADHFVEVLQEQIRQLDRSLLEKDVKGLPRTKFVTEIAVGGGVLETEDIDLLATKIGSPAKGLELDATRPVLLFGAEKVGVTTDGYSMIIDKGITSKIIPPLKEKAIKKEIKDLKEIERRAGREIKLTESQMREHAIKNYTGGNYPNYKQLIPKEVGEEEIKLVGLKLGDDYKRDTGFAYLSDKKGYGIAVNIDKLAHMRKHLPNAKMYPSLNSDGKARTDGVVVFKVKGKVKGLLMPMFVDWGKIPRKIEKAIKGAKVEPKAKPVKAISDRQITPEVTPIEAPIAEIPATPKDTREKAAKPEPVASPEDIEGRQEQRSNIALGADRARLAQNVVDPDDPKAVEKWLKHPENTDIKGVDTPGSPQPVRTARAKQRKKVAIRPRGKKGTPGLGTSR